MGQGFLAEGPGGEVGHRAITVLWSILRRMAREPPGPGGPLRYPLPDYFLLEGVFFNLATPMSTRLFLARGLFFSDTYVFINFLIMLITFYL